MYMYVSSLLDRAMIFEDIDRVIHPDKVIDRVVFDLDAEIKSRSFGLDSTSGAEFPSDSSSARDKR